MKYPEEKHTKFLQHVGTYIKKYMVPYPKKYKTSAISISSVTSIEPPLTANHPNL